MCVYRTPNSNINIFTETLDTILNNLNNIGKNIIIIGDFNIDFLVKSVNSSLQTMINSYGLQPIVDVLTRIGSTSKTAIDKIVLNKSLWDYNFMVIVTGFSNHYAQILQVQIQHMNSKRHAISKEEFRLLRSCRVGNVQYLNYLLDKEAWELVFRQT
jgi:hypothetical protein